MTDDQKKISNILVDRTVLDLISTDFIAKPERLIYDMLDDVQFIEEDDE